MIAGLMGTVLLVGLTEGGHRLSGVFEAEASSGSFTYDLEQMVTELQRLTGWDVAGIPRPQVEVLGPQEFSTRLNIDISNGMVFLGYYKIGREGRPDTILINRACLSMAPVLKLFSDALCHSTLFHELVHWVQTHRPLQHPQDRIGREGEALTWEERYLARFPSRNGGSSSVGEEGTKR